MARLNVLDVSDRVAVPPVDGTTTRSSQLLGHLSENHDVRQFSLARFADLRRLPFARDVLTRPSYREYRYLHPLPMLAWELSLRVPLGEPVRDWAGLRLCRPGRLRDWFSWADVVLVEYPWQFRHCHRLERRAPLVLATCNVEADNRLSYAEAAGSSARGGRRHRWIEAIERFAVTTADLVLAVSPEDKATFVWRYGVEPERIAVIPNGADTARFLPVDGEQRRRLKGELELPDRPTVIYLAAGRNPARRAGLAWVRKVASRMPDVTFVVTGTLFSRRTVEDNLVGTGLVDDPLPYLQAADASLCPIEFGGGTKIKVLESLAVGLPTVVFEETIHGLDVRHEQQVWVSEKHEQALESALRRVVHQHEFGRILGAAGRRFVVAHHDWKDIALRLETELLRLVEKPRVRRGGEGYALADGGE